MDAGAARHHALRHRGAARDAGREGLHHDRRRDRRHGDPAGPGLDWAISKKKDDYLGKRAQERTHMTDPRWKLVGLETLDGSVLPDGAYAMAEGENANGQRNTQGRVTSTYHSPTLGKGIAMGLVLHGPDRMGEVIEFATHQPKIP
jgi:sarcosine oxidase subunit alpha